MKLTETVENGTLNRTPDSAAVENPTVKNVLSNPQAWKGKEIAVNGKLTLRPDLSTVEGYVSSSGAGAPILIAPFLESAGLCYTSRYDLKDAVESENVITVLVEGRIYSGKVNLKDLLLQEGDGTVTGEVHIFGNSKLPYILIRR